MILTAIQKTVLQLDLDAAKPPIYNIVSLGIVLLESVYLIKRPRGNPIPMIYPTKLDIYRSSEQAHNLIY